MNTTHALPAGAAGPAIDTVPIRRVLISVFDKTGLERLAPVLQAAGVRVVSTGGTSEALQSQGVTVEDVAKKEKVSYELVESSLHRLVKTNVDRPMPGTVRKTDIRV